jgi:hypothetical protein
MAQSSIIGQSKMLTDPRPDAASTDDAKPGKRDRKTSSFQSNMVSTTTSISHLKTQQTGKYHELQSISPNLLEAKSFMAEWSRTASWKKENDPRARRKGRICARHLPNMERESS